jgi:hypothetical protein
MTVPTSKMIDRGIASFITNRDKLKAQAHKLALMIFDHANAHSDCTRAIKLAAALPNSWQPQMCAWFLAFTPIRVVLKNGKCELAPAYKKAAKENRVEFWNREAAEATPFYELTEEPKADKVYDFATLVALVTRLGKQIETKIEEGKVPTEDVESAREIASKVKKLSFRRVAANDTTPETTPAVAVA